MTEHPGDRIAALVDGRLDHATRERVLAHLAHCAPCRAEAEGQRRLKASLTALRAAPPLPGPDLTARLLALPADPAPTPVVARRAGGLLPSSGPVWGAPATPRTSRRPGGAGRPRTRTGPARRPRVAAAAAGALLAVSLAGALALGGPASSGVRAPVDPASPSFVADYSRSTSEVPLTEPVFATLVPAGLAGTER